MEMREKANLVIVGHFVALEFALVRSHQQVQVVSVEKVFGDVGPKVRSGAAQSVRAAPVRGLRVAPQHVKHLHTHKRAHYFATFHISINLKRNGDIKDVQKH
jgi:hypothetical protein